MSGSGLAWALPLSLLGKVKLPPRTVSMGLIADVHIGFSLIKGAEKRLEAFLEAMKKEKLDALVQLGDFAFPNAKHQAIVDRFNAAHEETIHVIGNHELDLGLTREDAVKSWGIPHSYYSREISGIKVIVLDGNDHGSPTYADHGGYHKYVGAVQREWLKKELESSQLPVVVMSHQPLAGQSAVDNADEMQKILSEHQDKILVAINGHSHVDQHIEVGGVHYVHINSASYYWLGGKTRLLSYQEPLFATLEIDPQAGELRIKGRKTEWSEKSPEEVGYYADGKNRERQEVVRPQIGSRKIDL